MRRTARRSCRGSWRASLQVLVVFQAAARAEAGAFVTGARVVDHDRVTVLIEERLAVVLQFLMVGRIGEHLGDEPGEVVLRLALGEELLFDDVLLPSVPLADGLGD